MTAFEAKAAEMDLRDELAAFRAEFYLPPGRVYLDGNSLGLLSRPAERAMLRTIDDWKRLGVDGWLNANPPWFTLGETLGQMTAPLLGANPDCVVVTNSATVNLHQLLASLYRPTPSRHKIVVDGYVFSSDRYAVQSWLRVRGFDPTEGVVEVAPREDRLIEEDDLIAALGTEVAAVIIPMVVFTTGQRLDCARICSAARERGILVGLDLCHSIGVMSHSLDDWGADFAFWCTYKHLSGGPGSTGGLYLNHRHHGGIPGLAGWFGSDKHAQFGLAPQIAPAPHAGAMQIGTPNIFSMAALLGAIELVQQAGIERIRAKSLQMTAFLTQMIEAELGNVAILSPDIEDRRGGHVAIAHPDAARITLALRSRGIWPDHREPDIIRIAPAPLYNTFAECVSAIRTLKEVADMKSYSDFDDDSLIP